jgi:glycosyltransferase involved in cell wall biosynthesis
MLLGAWPGIAAPLTVIGAGDRARLGLGRTPACVSFAGALPSAEVAAAMAGAAVLVFPSICYENCPLVVLEALSHGLPVIASRLGAVPELIEDGVTGLLFRAGDAGDLAAKVRWALAHGDELQRMGANAYAAYRRRFRPEPNVAALCAIYEAAMRARRAGR